MPQPHKGDRVYTPTRLHPDLAGLLRADARCQHIPVGDLIASYVAEHYDRADLAPPARATASPFEEFSASA